MKTDTAYSILPTIYEEILDCDYKEWSQYLYSVLTKLVKAGSNGIDAGCGTGYFTRLFSRMGYRMGAFDKSNQMLAAADHKAKLESLDIFFTNQSAQSFISLEKVQFVTAINDVINYLDKEELLGFFKSANDALDFGGYLIFDISTPYKLNDILSNNVFSEEFDNFSYIWFNQKCDDCVIMDLTIFIKDKKLYERFEERHIQYPHSPKFIKDTLKNTGFEIVVEEEFLSQLKPNKKTDRILFVAKKYE